MTANFSLIEVNPQILEDWGFCVSQINSHHPAWRNKLENSHIEKAWADFAPNSAVYQFHIKSGHFPRHHHFSVLAEVIAGKARIINIQEGHNTLF